MRDEDEETEQAMSAPPPPYDEHSPSRDEKSEGKKEDQIGNAVKGALKGFMQDRGKDKPKPTVGSVDIHPDIGWSSYPSKSKKRD